MFRGFLIFALLLPMVGLAQTPPPPPKPDVAQFTQERLNEHRSELTRYMNLLMQLVAALQQRLAISNPNDTTTAQTSGDRVVEVETEYVTIYTENGYRYFETKAIPDHDTGDFPNSGNPNTISEQDLSYKVTLNPEYIGAKTPVQLPGIALNGIPMEPGTAEREGGYNIEALQDTYNLGLDENNAHVQPTGLYHYHGVPEGYLDNHTCENCSVVLVGYAADGFPMYHSHSGSQTSGYELIGTRSDGTTADGTYTQDFAFTGTGTLDECNGGWIQNSMVDEDRSYAYFITDEFPYIPRCLNGIPDSSFNKGPGGGAPAGGMPPGGQPPRF